MTATTVRRRPARPRSGEQTTSAANVVLAAWRSPGYESEKKESSFASWIASIITKQPEQRTKNKEQIIGNLFVLCSLFASRPVVSVGAIVTRWYSEIVRKRL